MKSTGSLQVGTDTLLRLTSQLTGTEMRSWSDGVHNHAHVNALALPLTQLRASYR